MKDQDQNIAVAKFHGIININASCMRGHKDGVEVKIPDYGKDLNAMNQVERKLPATERDRYEDQLCRIVEKDHRMATISWLCINASASQRREALLRTLNLWTED